jgi:hypothetical protein
LTSCFFSPELAKFAQGALNVALAGGQQEIEVLVSIHGLYQRHFQLINSSTQASADIDWKSVETTICQTTPVCHGWIEPMLSFAGGNSGGPGCELLLEICDSAKAWRGADQAMDRTIGGRMFDAINGLRWRVHKFPYIKVAILKCQLAPPARKIHPGICQLLMPTMLRPLHDTDHLNAVAKVESILAEARGVRTTLALTQDELVRYVGVPDVRLCFRLLKTCKEFEDRIFTSEDEILKVRHPTTPNTYCEHCVLRSILYYPTECRCIKFL